MIGFEQAFGNIVQTWFRLTSLSTSHTHPRDAHYLFPDRVPLSLITVPHIPLCFIFALTMYSQTPSSRYSSATSAPREQPTSVTENVAVGGVDIDEDDEDMVEVSIPVNKNHVTAGHDAGSVPASGQDKVEAGLDVDFISNPANVAGNDIQLQDESEDDMEEVITPVVNETVTTTYNTSTGFEGDRTDADDDLAIILNPTKVVEKVAGNNDVQLKDKSVDATADAAAPLNNSTNTEQLNRSRTSDTHSTGENAPPVQPAASQSPVVDEDTLRNLPRRERRKARKEAEKLNPAPPPKPVPAHLAAGSVEATQRQQWQIGRVPAWYKTQIVPQPDAKGKGKGKAKAPEEPSAKGGRKRANSTEIQPDVGGSKKRRVAAADFPMPVMAVESSAPAQIYTYAPHVAASQQSVGPIIPQASTSGSAFSSSPYVPAGAYMQAPAPIMPPASTYASVPRVPLFTAPKAPTVKPSNTPSIIGYKPRTIPVQTKLINHFKFIKPKDNLYYAKQAIPDVEAARICPNDGAVVKIKDFEAHVAACHTSFQCPNHKELRTHNPANLARHILEIHLHEYNLYCPHCQARTQPPLNRMTDHLVRCPYLNKLEAQKKAEDEAKKAASPGHA